MKVTPSLQSSVQLSLQSTVQSNVQSTVRPPVAVQSALELSFEPKLEASFGKREHDLILETVPRLQPSIQDLPAETPTVQPAAQLVMQTVSPYGSSGPWPRPGSLETSLSPLLGNPPDGSGERSATQQRESLEKLGQPVSSPSLQPTGRPTVPRGFNIL